MEAYYRAGELQKANDIMARMKQLTEQELDYFLSLDKEYLSMVENETKRSMSIMQELSRLTRTYNQEEMTKEIDEKFKIYYDKYSSLFSVN